MTLAMDPIVYIDIWTTGVIAGNLKLINKEQVQCDINIEQIVTLLVIIIASEEVYH